MIEHFTLILSKHQLHSIKVAMTMSFTNISPIKKSMTVQNLPQDRQNHFRANVLSDFTLLNMYCELLSLLITRFLLNVLQHLTNLLGSVALFRQLSRYATLKCMQCRAQQQPRLCKIHNDYRLILRMKVCTGQMAALVYHFHSHLITNITGEGQTSC